SGRLKPRASIGSSRAAGSEGELAQADREREKRLVFPEELRGLQDRVQVADRVLLLANRPLAVEVDDGGEDVVEGHIRLEGVADRLLRRRRFEPEARLEGREHRRAIASLRLAEAQEVRVAESSG